MTKIERTLLAWMSVRLAWHTLTHVHPVPRNLQLITPFNIYFNSRLIVQKQELWRLLTNFFYFGSLGERGPMAGVPVPRVCSGTQQATLLQQGQAWLA